MAQSCSRCDDRCPSRSRHLVYFPIRPFETFPTAAIGVRGTTVWGGPIDNGYGRLVKRGVARGPRRQRAERQFVIRSNVIDRRHTVRTDGTTGRVTAIREGRSSSGLGLGPPPALAPLRAKWGWIVALGVVYVVAGVIALGSVVSATVATVFVVGIMMIIAGVAEVINAFQIKT
jgi:hypothetical protein